MHHMRSGKHPVKNRKQAIAIGLSKKRQKALKCQERKPHKPASTDCGCGSSSGKRYWRTAQGRGWNMGMLKRDMAAAATDSATLNRLHKQGES
jgi:hypothetical protein